MGRKVIDIAGSTFGRISVVARAGKDQTGSTLWLCRCSCGAEKNIAGHLLRRGQVKSCGCLRAEKGAAHLAAYAASGKHARLRHGDARAGAEAPEWRAWHSIKKRCDPKAARVSPEDAGRGIKMCRSWRTSYERFLADVGRRPGPQYTLDRKDNNGNYRPGNVRWATRKEQARNRRNSCWIQCGKERKTLAEWAEITGLKNTTIRGRLRAGWPVEKALTKSRCSPSA